MTKSRTERVVGGREAHPSAPVLFATPAVMAFVLLTAGGWIGSRLVRGGQLSQGVLGWFLAIAIPGGLLLLCLLPWMVVCRVVRRRLYRRLVRIEGGACDRCGYDLAGTPVGGACPECGRTREEMERGRARLARVVRWW